MNEDEMTRLLSDKKVAINLIDHYEWLLSKAKSELDYVNNKIKDLEENL